ncbi:hypothetical protein CE489_03865 [Bacillus spizizenii]|nr:hypothetical protein CE489_03865 [Bacillus spizizenii]
MVKILIFYMMSKKRGRFFNHCIFFSQSRQVKQAELAFISVDFIYKIKKTLKLHGSLKMGFCSKMNQNKRDVMKRSLAL